jgi:antitoxin HicB
MAWQKGCRVVEDRYEIDIFWSDEDAGFIAVVPDLPLCSAWGATREEALEQVQDAVGGHIKVRQKYGDPIPEPKPYTVMR